MLTLTPLTRAHHGAWLPLWNGFLEFYETKLPAATTDATFASLTDPDVEIYGALAHDATGTAIGLAHWHAHPGTWSTKRYCYLEDLFVDPGARGTGAGRALIEHVREWARQTDCAKVYWHTMHTNTVARALYDKVAAHKGEITYEMALEPR